MWFYQIKVLPAYQAVVFKNNTYYKTLETGSHSVFAGLLNNKSFFTILLPKTSQILTIKSISLISYQNFTYKLSYSIEYTIVNAKQFCKSFNVVQISQEGYRIPLDDFETKIELRSKSLFMRHGKMVSLKEFATDVDIKFSPILQELNDIYNDMGVKIDNINITNIEIGSMVGSFKNSLNFKPNTLALESKNTYLEESKHELDDTQQNNELNQKKNSNVEEKIEKKVRKKTAALRAFVF